MTSAQMIDSVRILTCNIYGYHGDWERRRPVLSKGIRALDPDLLTLQETMVTDAEDQAADLLGASYHPAHTRVREADRQGITIASRWPIQWTRELDLRATTRTGDFACTTFIAAILAPDPFGPLLLVNHFPDWQLAHEHERELQAVIAARAIESFVDERASHVILAGDLDAESDAASIRFLCGRQSLAGMSVCYRSAWDSALPGEPG